DRAVVEIAQTIRESLYRPNRRRIAKPKWIPPQLTQDAGCGHLLGGQWTATSRRFIKRFYLMLVKITSHPIVYGLLTNACDFGDFNDRSPLSDQKHCLQSLKGAFVIHIIHGFLEPRRVGSIEAKFCKALCSSHWPSLLPMLYFSKNFCRFT